MELSLKSCRLCLSETEFHVSLFGNHCRKTKLIDKILVCLKILIEETDFLTTICYKCAENVERYYEFTNFVKKSQTKFGCLERYRDPHKRNVLEESSNHVKQRVTSYLREQVIDADYTFSFLDTPDNEEKKESSPLFSYFSPNNVKNSDNMGSIWKTPRPPSKDQRVTRQERKQLPAQHNTKRSRDLFESQSQDVDDEFRGIDWRLTPDDNILNKVRERCFGRLDI